MSQDRLKITEIFYSLQGETNTVGLPTTFVRLTGCPLRCQYCDTAYAFKDGQWFTLDEILQKIAQFDSKYVTVTGGEPLAQTTSLKLLTQLCDQKYRVSLETSGALDISAVDPRVVKVLDIKTPGSLYHQSNKFNNLKFLTEQDQIKFVLCHRQDYEWAKQILHQHALTDYCEILFSPSYGQLDAGTLADWILQDQLPVRLQIQLHKYLWGDVDGK